MADENKRGIYTNSDMGDCPLFIQDPFASELRLTLLKTQDQVLCSSLSPPYLVLGTQKGLIHTLNLLENKGTVEADYHSAILDVHCRKTRVALCQVNRVAIHTLGLGGGTSHSCELEGVCTVRAVETAGGTYLVAASNSVIWLVDHFSYWSGVRKQVLRTFVSSPILSLAINHQVLVVLTALEVVLLALPTGSQIYQSKGSAFTSSTWVKPDLVVLANSRSYRYLHLTESIPGVIEVAIDQVIIHCAYEITSIAACNQKWIITYSPDRTLRVLSLKDKLEFEMRKPGSVTACLDYEYFFVVADLEVSRFRVATTQEQVDWLINHKNYEEALGLLQTQPSDTQIMRLCKEWLHDTLKNETEAAACKLCARLLEAGVSQKNVLKLICEDSLLLPLLTEIVSADVTLQDAQQLLPSLLLRGDEHLLIFCVRNWTLSLLHNDILVQPLLRSSFTEAKFEVFKRREQMKAAFDMLLSAKLSRIFRALRDYQEDAVIYVSQMNAQQIAVLCEIDSMKAIDLLVGRDDMSQDWLLQILPVAMHVTYAERLLKEGKRRSTKVDLVLLEEVLKQNYEKVVSFLHNSCLQVNHQALELCKRYNHIEGQILILSRMDRIGDLLPLLKADISIAVEYLRHHWDSTLWQSLVAELQKDDRLPGLLQLAYNHPSCFDICDIILPTCTARPHITPMLSHMQQYRALHTRSLAAAHQQLWQQQAYAASSMRRGKAVSHYFCAFCDLEITELGLFRQCGHHIHLECEIDEKCRLCEKR